NLATEVEKVNSVNRKLRETNAELTTELARYKNQERCFQNNQEKYDKLERCYQQSVYQEQCLSKKINALHLSSAGSENQPPMLNKENYVPWSSLLLRYAKSRPNGKNVGNLNGYNAVQNVGNKVIQNVVQNPRVQNIGNQNGLIGVPGNANQNLNGKGNLVAVRAEGNATRHNGNQIRCYNYSGVGHLARNCTVRPRRRDAAYLQTRLLIAQKEEAGIQLQAEEFDLMAVAADLNEIEEVNVNCILMANLQQALTLGTQTDKAPVCDSDGSAEYTELLEPILEPHQVPHNDNNIISEVTSVEQSGETVEQHPANVEETRALYDSLYQNLAIEVEKVNTVNRKLIETNAELTTELKRFKNQEKCFEISQEKYDKLERCYQKSVYQEQCLSKKINVLHLSSELEIKRLLRAVVIQDIMSIVEKASVVDTSNLQTELKHTKESFEKCIIKKENEYAKLWNDWSNTKNDRVPSASKSSRSKNKAAEVEERHRNLLLYKNTKHMSYACNNIKLDSQNAISKVVCAMCKQCLISVNHDVCLSKSDILFEEINMMFQQLMEGLNEENQAKIEEMNQVTHTSEPSRRFNTICYDDDDDYDYEENTIPLSDIISQIPPSIVITTSFQSQVSPRIHLGVIMLEDIECKDSYDSNLDESTFLVTPLSNSNEDEYFATGDDVELLLHRDQSTPMMSVASIIEGFTDEAPLKENDDLFDLEHKNDDWKKILYDAPINDLMSEDCPDLEASRAPGFVHRPLELLSLACYYMGIRYPRSY
nr:hypothetical protein [Tanacetum cinerariifolium]